MCLKTQNKSGADLIPPWCSRKSSLPCRKGMTPQGKFPCTAACSLHSSSKDEAFFFILRIFTWKCLRRRSRCWELDMLVEKQVEVLLLQVYDLLVDVLASQVVVLLQVRNLELLASKLSGWNLTQRGFNSVRAAKATKLAGAVYIANVVHWQAWVCPRIWGNQKTRPQTLPSGKRSSRILKEDWRLGCAHKREHWSSRSNLVTTEHISTSHCHHNEHRASQGTVCESMEILLETTILARLKAPTATLTISGFPWSCSLGRKQQTANNQQLEQTMPKLPAIALYKKGNAMRKTDSIIKLLKTARVRNPRQKILTILQMGHLENPGSHWKCSLCAYIRRPTPHVYWSLHVGTWRSARDRNHSKWPPCFNLTMLTLIES